MPSLVGRQLVSSERYYKALAANSADAVVVLDARGRIANESPHLAALLGHPGESICGIGALSAVCAQDAPNAAAGQLRHLRAERCQLGQGYLFSQPVDTAEAGALLAGNGFPTTPEPLRITYAKAAS